MAEASGRRDSLASAASAFDGKQDRRRQRNTVSKAVRMLIRRLAHARRSYTRLCFAPDEFKLFEQSCKPKWFLQENRVGRKFGFRKIFGISGHVDHLYAGLKFCDAASEFGAAQSGHDNVGEENVQFFFLLCDLDSFRGSKRFMNGI